MARTDSSPRFRVYLHVEATLSVDQLWPDGDAPANPTAEDVQALIDDCGGLDIIDDWNLADRHQIEVYADGYVCIQDGVRRFIAANRPTPTTEETDRDE